MSNIAPFARTEPTSLPQATVYLERKVVELYAMEPAVKHSQSLLSNHCANIRLDGHRFERWETTNIQLAIYQKFPFQAIESVHLWPSLRKMVLQGINCSRTQLDMANISAALILSWQISDVSDPIVPLSRSVIGMIKLWFRTDRLMGIHSILLQKANMVAEILRVTTGLANIRLIREYKTWRLSRKL